MGKNLGRFSIMDGRATRIAADEARKTKIATFPGEHYSSELENGQLHVYSHTDEHGNPAKKFGEPEGSSGIRSSAGSGLDTAGPEELHIHIDPGMIHQQMGSSGTGIRSIADVGGISSLAELNAMNSKHWSGVGVRRRA